MQAIKKFSAVALYLLLLLVLMYGATILVFILAVWLPTSSVVLFILGMVIGIASGYLFFRVSGRFTWPLAEPALRKIAGTVFAILGLLFSLVAALLALLMQRSGEYLPVHIAQAVAPLLVWMALCMGLIIAGRLMNRMSTSALGR